MEVVAGKAYSDVEMRKVYAALPHQWLLMEVLERDEHGRASKLRLIRWDADKDALFDWLMDEDVDWDWDKDYIVVWSDPEKECPLA